MARQRLQKIIAQAGFGSRRKAEQLIVAGRVRVNGKVVTELGSSADPSEDRIEFDGKRLVAESLMYLLLHKPRGVVSTMSDPEGRPTVAEYVERVGVRVFPVGRLDFATSGALLLTNDGDFANALLRPRQAVPKTYVLKLSGIADEEQVDALRKGVELEDGMTLPAKVKLLRHDEGGKTWLEVTLHEGRNQQLRRMAQAIGFEVMRLARISFAGLTCEGLRPGEHRTLTAEELRDLQKNYGVPKRIHSASPRPAANARRTPAGAARVAAPGGAPRPARARRPARA